MRNGLTPPLFMSWLQLVRIIGLCQAIAAKGLGFSLAGIALGIATGALLGISHSLWYRDMPFALWPVVLNLWAASLLSNANLPSAVVGLMMITWSLHRYERSETPPAPARDE